MKTLPRFNGPGQFGQEGDTQPWKKLKRMLLTDTELECRAPFARSHHLDLAGRGAGLQGVSGLECPYCLAPKGLILCQSA